MQSLRDSHIVLIFILLPALRGKSSYEFPFQIINGYPPKVITYFNVTQILSGKMEILAWTLWLWN